MLLEQEEVYVSVLRRDNTALTHSRQTAWRWAAREGWFPTTLLRCVCVGGGGGTEISQFLGVRVPPIAQLTSATWTGGRRRRSSVGWAGGGGGGGRGGGVLELWVVAKGAGIKGLKVGAKVTGIKEQGISHEGCGKRGGKYGRQEQGLRVAKGEGSMEDRNKG